jgi:hypothetical protein
LKTKQNVQRNELIAQLRKEGFGYSEIAAHFKIAKARVAQICKRENLKPSKYGIIYFLQIERFIKIGFCKDLKSRVYHYSAPYDPIVLGIFHGTRRDEALAHERFAYCRHRREWYRATPELLDWINERAEPVLPLGLVEPSL